MNVVGEFERRTDPAPTGPNISAQGIVLGELPADPIVLTSREFNLVPEEIRSAFQEYRQGYGIEELHDEILDPVSSIPYAQADGLGSSITRILKTMQRDIHAKDPQAINSAESAVIAVTRADVQALAQEGRIVVR